MKERKDVSIFHLQQTNRSCRSPLIPFIYIYIYWNCSIYIDTYTYVFFYRLIYISILKQQNDLLSETIKFWRNFLSWLAFTTSATGNSNRLPELNAVSNLGNLYISLSWRVATAMLRGHNSGNQRQGRGNSFASASLMRSAAVAKVWASAKLDWLRPAHMSS